MWIFCCKHERSENERSERVLVALLAVSRGTDDYLFFVDRLSGNFTLPQRVAHGRLGAHVAVEPVDPAILRREAVVELQPLVLRRAVLKARNDEI